MGEHRNNPIVRFGRVALLPEDKIPWQENGKSAESVELYLLETQSYGGNSGSPAAGGEDGHPRSPNPLPSIPSPGNCEVPDYGPQTLRGDGCGEDEQGGSSSPPTKKSAKQRVDDALGRKTCYEALGFEDAASAKAAFKAIEQKTADLGIILGAEILSPDGGESYDVRFVAARTVGGIIYLNENAWDSADQLIAGTPISITDFLSNKLGLDRVLSLEEFQAIMLTHEFGHIRNAIPSDATIDSNGVWVYDTAKSLINTKTIFDKCFK